MGQEKLRIGQEKRTGTSRRQKFQKAEDKRDFGTFAMTSVKHLVAHRPKIGECAQTKTGKGKSRGYWTVRRVEREHCGRKMEQWSLRSRTKVSDSENTAFVVEEKIVYPVAQIDD